MVAVRGGGEAGWRGGGGAKGGEYIGIFNSNVKAVQAGCFMYSVPPLVRDVERFELCGHRGATIR